MAKKKKYRVGYKKPPVAKQFQPGKSGNPRGRPKKQLHTLTADQLSQAREARRIIDYIDNNKFLDLVVHDDCGEAQVRISKPSPLLVAIKDHLAKYLASFGLSP